MIEHVALLVRGGLGRYFDAKRIAGFLDILLAAMPLLFGGMLVTLGYVQSVLVGSYVLKLRKTGWREIGLRRPQSWPRTILFGVLAFAAVMLSSVLVQGVIPTWLGMEIAPIDESRFDPLVGDVPTLIFGITLAWTTIGFGEEMLFRAFLINRFSAVFGRMRGAGLLAVVCSAVMFGMAHYMAEGLLGAASTTLMGLVLGLFYVRCRRGGPAFGRAADPESACPVCRSGHGGFCS